MPKLINLEGEKFGRLTVVGRSANSSYNRPMWLCKCDCGNEIIVLGSDIRRGHTKSCGCYRKEITCIRSKKHGRRNTSLYKTWINMKSRCLNSHSKDFSDYGGRGITICDEWKDDFQTFYEWSIANGYRDDLTIDRIDVNGNYKPSNCRWVTIKEQANNKRNNHYVELDGEIHTLAEWSEITGIKAGTLWYRITSGWDVKRALTL